jgi:hypothetical protein
VNIKSASDMAGKKIGLTRATLEEATVPGIAPSSAQIVYFDDIAATLQAMISDRSTPPACPPSPRSRGRPQSEGRDREQVHGAHRVLRARPCGRATSTSAVPAHVGVPQQAQRRSRRIYQKYTRCPLVDLPAM